MEQKENITELYVRSHDPRCDRVVEEFGRRGVAARVRSIDDPQVKEELERMTGGRADAPTLLLEGRRFFFTPDDILDQLDMLSPRAPGEDVRRTTSSDLVL